MTKLKTKKEISVMREGGSLLAQAMAELKEETRPGMATKELDRLARRIIDEKGGKPSFLNYQGFPAAICTSINDVVVHGVPSSQEIKSGDLVSLDLGFEYRGYHTDMAITFPVGEVSEKALRLMRATKESLRLAIKESQSGKRLGDVGSRIENYIKEEGFKVVEGLCGHGIGREVHEDPQILNTGKPGTGMKIVEGMVFCIEPMVAIESSRIFKAEEGIKTSGLSAHFEHTVAIIDGKAEVLTKTD